jgi:GNAT superfamily N-acetyltransferase
MGGCYGSPVNDAQLADLEHENMIQAMTSFCASVAGARVWRADGTAVISTGLPFVLFNQVVVDGEATLPAAIAAGVSVMREGRGPFVVNLRSGRDDRFVPLMGELGLVPISEQPWMPGMAWHPVAEAVPVDLPGFEVRRVRDLADLDDHVTTGAAAFELPEEIIRAVVVPPLIDRADAPIYVGYEHDVPVSTGLGIRSGRTIGVYNIATIESARGRGYGAAITRRVVSDGIAAGCDVAILQASEMGYPVYERLGFRTVVEYVGYVDPSVPA